MMTIRLKMNEHGEHARATQTGDHRMVQLVIPLPRAVAVEVKSCVALLSLDGGEPIVTQLITEGDSGDAYIKEKKAYLVLHQPWSYCSWMRLQLECYSGAMGNTDSFIARSAISEVITFKDSLAHGLEDLPEALAAPGAVSELISLLPALRELLAGGGLPGDLQALVDAAVENALAPWITALWNGLNGPSQK